MKELPEQVCFSGCAANPSSPASATSTGNSAPSTATSLPAASFVSVLSSPAVNERSAQQVSICYNRLLGSGCYAKVYVGQLNGSTEVAVKVAIGGGFQDRDRARQEIRIWRYAQRQFTIPHTQ
jgi:hypothetical protein